MFIDLDNIAQLQKLFKKPIQEQQAYFDLNTGALGKFDKVQTEPFELNRTETGFIDGGDSTFHTGHYYTGIALLQAHGVEVNAVDKDDVESKMSDLYASWTWGIYRRFPNNKAWYGDADRMSRDQQKSLISTEALNNTKGSIKRITALILRHLLFRGLLFDAKTRQNGSSIACHGKTCDYSFKMPTFTGPTIWASYIRYAIQKNKWAMILYPLLLVLDIELIANGIVKRTIDKEDKDVMNHINYSIWFHYAAPTPWTFILNKFVNKKSDLKARMYKYYDNGREPFMTAVIWDKLIDLYMED